MWARRPPTRRWTRPPSTCACEDADELLARLGSAELTGARGGAGGLSRTGARTSGEIIDAQRAVIGLQPGPVLRTRALLPAAARRADRRHHLSRQGRGRACHRLRPAGRIRGSARTLARPALARRAPIRRSMRVTLDLTIGNDAGVLGRICTLIGETEGQYLGPEFRGPKAGLLPAADRRRTAGCRASAFADAGAGGGKRRGRGGAASAKRASVRLPVRQQLARRHGKRKAPTWYSNAATDARSARRGEICSIRAAAGRVRFTMSSTACAACPIRPERIARGIWAGVFTTFTPFSACISSWPPCIARVMRGNILACAAGDLLRQSADLCAHRRCRR